MRLLRDGYWEALARIGGGLLPQARVVERPPSPGFPAGVRHALGVVRGTGEWTRQEPFIGSERGLYALAESGKEVPSSPTRPVKRRSELDAYILSPDMTTPCTK